MATYEHPLVYAMIAHDALQVQRDHTRNVMDITRWPENDRTNAGSFRPKRKPVCESLHPALEDGIVGPMLEQVRPEDHTYNIEEGVGNLPAQLAGAVSIVRSHPAGIIPQAMGMGRLAHWLIDLWNPFNLVPNAVGARFINDVAAHVAGLPFLLREFEGEETPYEDQGAITVCAERIAETYVNPLANAYMRGNGYPAAKPVIRKWYDDVTNELAKLWLILL